MHPDDEIRFENATHSSRRNLSTVYDAKEEACAHENGPVDRLNRWSRRRREENDNLFPNGHYIAQDRETCFPFAAHTASSPLKISFTLHSHRHSLARDAQSHLHNRIVRHDEVNRTLRFGEELLINRGIIVKNIDQFSYHSSSSVLNLCVSHQNCSLPLLIIGDDFCSFTNVRYWPMVLVLIVGYSSISILIVAKRERDIKKIKIQTTL